MKRIAILIEASNIKGHVELPGARADQANMYRWLLGNEGGAWENHEVLCLSTPSLSQLETALARGATADYLFVAFSGHGEHVKGSYVDYTMVQINETCDYAVQKMNKGAPKALIIADSCRNIRSSENLSAETWEKHAKTFTESKRRVLYRDMFDRHVALAEPGTIFAFGCSLNQSAVDHPNGGAFTFSLIDAAETWSAHASGASVYSIANAFEAAKCSVQQIERTQIPSLEGSIRRKHFFPFAVEPS